MTQPAWYSLRVTYLFTGQAWHADVGQCFRKLLLEFTNLPDSGFKATLAFREHDLLPNDAIIDQALATKVLDGVRDACDILFVLPDLPTFARSRHSHRTGPRPVRDKAYPRGRPLLQPSEKEAVQRDNDVLDFARLALTTAFNAGAHFLFGIPEDLGKSTRGTPASPWQDEGMRALSHPAILRGAFYQQDWAPDLSLNPTAILTTAVGLEACTLPCRRAHFQSAWSLRGTFAAS